MLTYAIIIWIENSQTRAAIFTSAQKSNLYTEIQITTKTGQVTGWCTKSNKIKQNSKAWYLCIILPV